MKEYIDREAVYAEIDKGDLLVGNNAEWAKEIVHRTPTADVVEVVRCRSCAWWEPRTYGSCIGRCQNPGNGLYRDYTDEDDYCSYGKRKNPNE